MRVEWREHVGKLLLTSDDRRGLDGQVRLVEGIERREVLVAELIEPLGRREVVEPVEAQVAQAVRTDQVARRLRDQDLAAVTCGGDTRCAMDIDSDITLVGPRGLARCSPMRTRIGPLPSSSRAAAAAARASVAVGNATKNASPCVSTSKPPRRAKASRSARRCSARRPA
jgi:hypothetical protein